MVDWVEGYASKTSISSWYSRYRLDKATENFSFSFEDQVSLWDNEGHTGVYTFVNGKLFESDIAFGGDHGLDRFKSDGRGYYGTIETKIKYTKGSTSYGARKGGVSLWR